MIDLLIKNAIVIDGLGNEPFTSDVGIFNGTIVQMGNLKFVESKREINADTLFLAPGFFSIASSSSKPDFEEEEDGLVSCGVTSRLLSSGWNNSSEIKPNFFNSLLPEPRKTNLGAILPVNWLDNCREIEKLKASGVKASSLDFSTIGKFQLDNYQNLIETLCRYEVPLTLDFKKLFLSGISHDDLLTELLVRNLKLLITNFSIPNPDQWDQQKSLFKFTDALNADNKNILTAVSPYSFFVDKLSLLLSNSTSGNSSGHPDWGRRTADPLVRTMLNQKMNERFGEESYSRIRLLFHSQLEEFCGQNLIQISQQLEMSPAKTVLWLINETSDSSVEPLARYDFFSDSNLELAAVKPYNTISYLSDSFRADLPFHRGTYPRAIRVLVKERQTVTLPKLINSFTDKIARWFNIRQRGSIQIGNQADLVLFDFRACEDLATFERPRLNPLGIVTTIVNGITVHSTGNQSENNFQPISDKAGTILR